MYTNYGYLKDFPDIRDLSPDHEDIQPLLAKTAYGANVASALPPKVDLRQWCSPVPNQGNIGSCTAHSAMGMVEYFQNKIYGKFIPGSRLFQYKMTRYMLKWTGDTGAFLRTAMGALVLFGVAPESYWPYKETDYDVMPPWEVGMLAQSFQALKYYRLDPPGSSSADILQKVKACLATQQPAMFGFTVYKSIAKVGANGLLPFPAAREATDGGHAVLAVGYDDTIVTNVGKGAIIVKNSWGKAWGEGGYFYMPYEYITRGLASDWWTMTSAEYVDTGVFAS